MSKLDTDPMRLVLAAVLLVCSTALAAAAEGAPGSEDETFQCRFLGMGCKAPETFVAPAPEQPEALPPRKKVAAVKRKRKPKPKPKVEAPAAAATPAAPQ